MPNLKFLENKQKSALQRAEEYLQKYKCKKLKKYQIEKYDARHAIYGWRIFHPEMENTDFDLDIFFNNEFPYSLPMVAITPAPKFLQYPHIEKDGYLCLGELIADDNAEIEENVERMIEESLDLIFGCLENKNQANFKDEIISYWDRAIESKDTPFLSVLDTTKNESRMVIACTENKVIAEDETNLRHWLKSRNAGKSQVTPCKALFLWPKNIFSTPSDYPNNIKDLYSYIKNEVKDNAIVKEFEAMIESFVEPIIIAFGFNVKDRGVAIVGVEISMSGQKSFKGFRPEKMTMRVAMSRGYPRDSSCQKINIQRVDPKWSLSRDNDDNLDYLRTKKVTVIGCGAIGSAVARLLAQSGVGYFNLVDYDNMAWENIGRHALGASLIDASIKKKVNLLERMLNFDFPHLKIDSVANRWERVPKEKNHILKETDLIIMATGSWETDSAMNDYMLDENNFPPIIYSWAEAFACAGHSLAIFKKHECRNCFFTRNEFKFNMTQEFGKENFQVAGCVETFNPFGNIELMPICAMIAEMSLDVLLGKVTRSQLISWINAKKCAIEKKGKWSDKAEKAFQKNNNDYGYFRNVLELSGIHRCGSCSNLGV